jgi:Bacterial capsule synthesis protein PGA_cap
MTQRTPRVGVERFLLLLAVLVGCARGPKVSVWLGGDVDLGHSEADRRLAPLADELAGAVGIVNLEGAVGEVVAARPGTDASVLPTLRRAGVDVVGVANNHAADGDPRRTVAALRAAGLVPAGLAAGPAVLVRGGVRLVVTSHFVEATTDWDDLVRELISARALGDVLIATFHTVGPPSYLPSPVARAAVAAARRARAQVIAVHGSHALARVERDGSEVVAWGLGNLVMTCACTDDEDGLLLRVALDRRGVVDAEIVAVTAGLAGRAARPAREPALVFQLLETLGSTPLAETGVAHRRALRSR